MKKQTKSEYGIYLRTNVLTFQKINQRREGGNGTSPDWGRLKKHSNPNIQSLIESYATWAGGRGEKGESYKEFGDKWGNLSMDYMLNNVDRLVLFFDAMWYCGWVRKCPCSWKMHTYVFRGEVSWYLQPVFRFGKKKLCVRVYRSSLYIPFDFSVGLKFFNNDSNKPIKVYQELKISRNETDKWRGRREWQEHFRNRKQCVQRLGGKRERTARNYKLSHYFWVSYIFGRTRELWRILLG